MWSVVTPVPAGTHEFKFVVDGEWKHSTRHPTVGEDDETMNNIRVIRGPPKNKQNTARLSEQRNKDAGVSTAKQKKCCVVSYSTAIIILSRRAMFFLLFLLSFHLFKSFARRIRKCVCAVLNSNFSCGRANTQGWLTLFFLCPFNLCLFEFLSHEWVNKRFVLCSLSAFWNECDGWGLEATDGRQFIYPSHSS